MKLIRFLQQRWLEIKQGTYQKQYQPSFRIVGIEQDESKNYLVTVQVVAKNVCFVEKPELILKHDTMIDSFSPTDVRTLTYLGYLDINRPQYEILAKKYCAKDHRMHFAIQNRHDQSVESKTAAEIAKDKAMLAKLSQQDAHLIGHTQALEADDQVSQVKAKLLSNANK